MTLGNKWYTKLVLVFTLVATLGLVTGVFGGGLQVARAYPCGTPDGYNTCIQDKRYEEYGECEPYSTWFWTDMLYVVMKDPPGAGEGTGTPRGPSCDQPPNNNCPQWCSG